MTATVTGQNRAAVLHGPGDVRVEERAIPEPGSREILVEIAAVGVCGSDIHYYEHGRIGSFVVREPMVLGHESAGRVVAHGPGASKHAVGDRVTLEPGVPCGNCRECRSGRYNLCRDVRFFATPPIDGAFANYVTIHEDFAFALPDSVSDEAGALMEPLSVGVWACQKANVTAGDRVLVTGAGPIGLLAAQCARAFGATEITVTDVNPDRLALAGRTGATRTINVAEEPLEHSGVEADALIECSGHPSSLKAGIAALRPAGTAVLVGMGPEEEGVVPLSLIQNRELWVTGTFRYANTYPTAIALAANGKVDLEAIITGHYGLDEAEAALRVGREDPTAVKVMVMPAGGAANT
ncbi:MAG: NAD(P)-dependent alcohol dehydrogenase [Candidatus Limnocylindria bacterium]